MQGDAGSCLLILLSLLGRSGREDGLGPRWAMGILDPSVEERRLAWKYPSCSHLAGVPGRRVDWPAFRASLHARRYPENMHAVMAVLDQLAGKTSAYDEEARDCLMGIPAAFFFLVKHTLETMDRDADGRPTDSNAIFRASFQYSVMENYISALHPGLIDRSNWTITDAEVMAIRKEILGLYRDLETEESAAGALQDEQPPLRIYVYDEAEVPELKPLLHGQIYCSRGQWGTDVHVHDFFVTYRYRTTDPREADFFFVPGYGICELEGNVHTLDEIDTIYQRLVQALPYFNASGGRDHVFVFGSGMAHSVFQSWKEYMPQAIVLTPETELFNDFAWIAEPPFQTWKDIAIPGSLDLAEVISLVESSKPLAERRYLAAFFGRVAVERGPHPWVGGVDVRREILQLGELQDTEDLLFGDNATHDIMHAAYGDARFCFVPRGKSGWSLRFFEAIFAGCVPVMISDKWELPFEDFIDVTRFVIKWPSTQIGEGLLSYLRSLPDVVVQSYMDEAQRQRCWYFYPPKKFDVRGVMRENHKVCPEANGQDAFRGVLRALRARRRRSKTSTRSFYFRGEDGQLKHVDADLRPWR